MGQIAMPSVMQGCSIAVIGAGSWGITLACHLNNRGFPVALWEFDPAVADRLDRQRQHPALLPGITIPDRIRISDRFEDILDGEVGMIVLAVPSHVLRGVVRKAAPCVQHGQFVVSVVKGIENGTLMRMTEVLAEELPQGAQDRVAVLSGPSHAEEVIQGIPTSVVAAAGRQEVAEAIQQAFLSDRFRVYTNLDVVGVELAGALKNIIAIAAGISDGLGFGDNTKGALLTRGLAEITRLGVSMGARPATFAGLAGVGDLITTCLSRHSRNRYVGEGIGKGRSLVQIQKEMVMVAEGVMTTRAAYRLAQVHGIEMPITNEVHAVLFEEKDPAQAVADLMTRTAKAEVW